MATLQIRFLPEDVREALSLRAELEHRSLAQQAIVELRRMPELQASARRKAVLERVARDLATAGASLPLDPVSLIREDRER